MLNTELQKQVLTNHEDLLSQATWVEKLEGVLFIMQSHIQVIIINININAEINLKSKVRDIMNLVLEPSISS